VLFGSEDGGIAPHLPVGEINRASSPEVVEDAKFETKARKKKSVAKKKATKKPAKKKKAAKKKPGKRG